MEEDDDDPYSLELQVMCREYEWFLREEVNVVLNDLKNLITEALKNFNLSSNHFAECQVKPEKFLLSCPNGVHQSKCMVTLSGDQISEADLGIRLQKQPVIIYQTRIYPEVPWKLQQIQDAGNHLQRALSAIDNNSLVLSLTSGAQVLTIIDDLISFLKLGRECICLPKIQPLDQIRSSSNKVFKPPLPQDTVAWFFIQAQKLILAVHHHSSNLQNKTEIGTRYQLECSVPWLNDALLVLTIALHKCQQLKDKVAVFSSYEAKLNQLRSRSQNSSRSNSRMRNSPDLLSTQDTTSFNAPEAAFVRLSCAETNEAEVTSF